MGFLSAEVRGGVAAPAGIEASHTLERVEATADLVRRRVDARPEVAVILGTGLGGLVR